MDNRNGANNRDVPGWFKATEIILAYGTLRLLLWNYLLLLSKMFDKDSIHAWSEWLTLHEVKKRGELIYLRSVQFWYTLPVRIVLTNVDILFV